MEDFDENDEMAAMMGFSSFGGTKKRKFEQTKSPAKEEYSASGANSTELGVRIREPENQTSGGGEPPSAATAANAAMEQPPPAGGLASFLARGQALPTKPPQAVLPQPRVSSRLSSSASELVSFGGPSIPRAELNALRQGVPNEHGDLAYFLPSFVEDPWETLSTSRP